MARSGFPSMTALLGVLAVAGYQNRDKLAEMLGNRGGGGLGGSGGGLGGALGGARAGSAGGMGDLGSLLGGLVGGGGGRTGGLGGLLGGGLSELQGRFDQAGRRDQMDSWVGTGPNRQIEPNDLEAALGPDVLGDLTETTGLSREEILRRLSRELPEAVNQYTPNGRLPRDDDFA